MVMPAITRRRMLLRGLHRLLLAARAFIETLGRLFTGGLARLHPGQRPQNMLTDQNGVSVEVNDDLGWADATSISVGARRRASRRNRRSVDRRSVRFGPTLWSSHGKA
jgi:hypothetical protein